MCRTPSEKVSPGGVRAMDPPAKRSWILVDIKGCATNQIRAKVTLSVAAPALQGVAVEHINPVTTAYSDDAGACEIIPKHETVRLSASEQVKGDDDAYQRR